MFGICFLVERYDPRQNKWTLVAPMSTRRKHLGCAVYNNWIYAVGGRDDATELSSAERYNPHTNTWSPIVAMSSRRSGVSWLHSNDRKTWKVVFFLTVMFFFCSPLEMNRLVWQLLTVSCTPLVVSMVRHILKPSRFTTPSKINGGFAERWTTEDSVVVSASSRCLSTKLIYGETILTLVDVNIFYINWIHKIKLCIV